MAESLEKRSLAQDAEQVQIGEIRLELSGRSRAVENHALQVLPGGLLHAADKFLDLFFRVHSETSCFANLMEDGRPARPSLNSTRTIRTRRGQDALGTAG